MNLLAFLKSKSKPFLSLSFHKFKLMNVLFVCFLFGLIYGFMIVIFNFNEVSFHCSSLIRNFLNRRLSESFLVTCLSSFLSYFIPIFFLFILGFVPISQFIFFIVPIFYGLGFSLIVSCLMVFKGIEGLLIALLEVFPCALISVLVLILSCKEGFRFANKIFKRIFFKVDRFSYRSEIKIYFLKFLTLALFQMVAAVIDGFFNFVFVKL